MRFQSFKADNYCVGGRHRSATTNFYGDISSKVSKVLNEHCSISNGKILMTVGDNTITAEALGDYFMNLDKKGPNVSKKMAKSF